MTHSIQGLSDSQLCSKSEPFGEKIQFGIWTNHETSLRNGDKKPKQIHVWQQHCSSMINAVAKKYNASQRNEERSVSGEGESNLCAVINPSHLTHTLHQLTSATWRTINSFAIYCSKSHAIYSKSSH